MAGFPKSQFRMPGFDGPGGEPSNWDLLGRQAAGGIPGEIQNGNDHIVQSALPAGLSPGFARKGGAVTGANSDNYRRPNQAGSEQVAQKAGSEMDRVPSLAGDSDLTPIGAGIRLSPVAFSSLFDLDQPGAVHDTRYPPPFGYGLVLDFFDVHRHVYRRRAGDVAAHAERVGSRSR